MISIKIAESLIEMRCMMCYYVFLYRERFGINFVDFEDPDRPRTSKMSSFVYKNIVATHTVDVSYTPDGFEPCDFSVKKN